MDLLIVGAGLSSAVVANRAAKEGKKVLILEKRDQVGGNVFDKEISGVRTHMYGPHIFHTNSERVNKYMSQFWKLNDFRNVVEGEVAGKVVPIPFNFRGIDRFWPGDAQEIKDLLVQKYGKDERVSIATLLKQDNELLKEVANFVYENVFLNYTTKMWDKKPFEIDESVLSRVPVVIGNGDRYFSDKYEGVPVEGYTPTILKMLDHKNIEVRTNSDATELLEKKGDKLFFEDLEVSCPIVYAAPLDEFFGFDHGSLDYRSLKIVFEEKPMDRFQATGVVNYPAHPTMTRITEYKNLTLQEVKGITVISREYPGKYERGDSEFGTRFYPNPTEASRRGYEKYAKLATKYPNLYPIGRLATYKYLNMDQAVETALELADKILA